MRTRPRRSQLRKAKAGLSELVHRARVEGPREIAVRDKHVSQKPSFVEFIRRSPLAGVNLGLERDRSLPRRVPL